MEDLVHILWLWLQVKALTKAVRSKVLEYGEPNVLVISNCTEGRDPSLLAKFDFRSKFKMPF